jgi:hypothetical protein
MESIPTFALRWIACITLCSSVNITTSLPTGSKVPNEEDIKYLWFSLDKDLVTEMQELMK